VVKIAESVKSWDFLRLWFFRALKKLEISTRSKPKHLRQQLVRPVAHGGVVGPGDDDDFVEFQAQRQVIEARGDLLVCSNDGSVS